MATINQKLNCHREQSIYNFVWNLDCDVHGKILIFDYSKWTKQNLFPSGQMFCKTGCFQGPGKYFEFFSLIQGKKMEIFLKMVHPSKEPTEWCGETFHISSACVLTNESYSFESKRQSSNTAYFVRSDAPKGIADADDVSLKSTVNWMKATFPDNSPMPMTSVTCLQMRVTLQQNKWGETPNLRQTKYSLDRISSDITDTINLDTSLHLFSPKFSDCNLKCGDQEYPAHRMILANKSSVFEAMFSNPMEENLTGRVNIVDSEPEVVEELLRFIYTGTVLNLKENASGLFSIAEMYNVQDLKLMCENYLVETISIENVLERYALGKLNNSDTMVKKCVEKMKAEKKTIWSTIQDLYDDCQKFPELFDMVFP